MARPFGFGPRATAVYLNGSFAGTIYDQQTGDRLLSRDAVGYWTGFQPGARDGDLYRFWVGGSGSSSYKREPYACELANESDFPNCFSVLIQRCPYNKIAKVYEKGG